MEKRDIDINKILFQIGVAAENWKEFIVDGEVKVDRDAILCEAVEAAELDENIVAIVSTDPNVIYALETLEDEVEGAATDFIGYQSAMNGTVSQQLGYYGMSIKDFL